MVRRTKADALATRNSLLDAAEQLFQERGVSRTSLNDIATAAGTTRGAIYWHFKDKADLFNAMMERVTMPLEGTLACNAREANTTADPLLALRDSMMSALHQTATDDHTRRVFEVATHKVEYVSEMQAVRDRHLQVRNECMDMTQEILQQAVQRQGITLNIPLSTAALGLHVIMDGLIQNWLLDPDAFDLVQSGRDTMEVYLAGLGFAPPTKHMPRRAASAARKPPSRKLAPA
ncbi:TetR family transcriptional regulator [Hydrogenophaga sp. BPS33]|uniref:TetR family transcriptional regulator n=1 Tax=Hydrogenophaga sp. BPS33 TaxID=2651974 RepID=UPI00131F6CD3|nr:TetR family transcriptional regulator [Hydrogenophaga sp. BPS33]QHE85636.1 TetR family transcriptional regulator [Hydrogenophaga sp. BPS33]